MSTSASILSSTIVVSDSSDPKKGGNKEEDGGLNLGPQWLNKRSQDNGSPSLLRTGSSISLMSKPAYKYTKQELLSLHRPTTLPAEEFNAPAMLLSKESLSPIAFLPTHLQEEPSKNVHVNKSRYNSPRTGERTPGTPVDLARGTSRGSMVGPRGSGMSRGRGRGESFVRSSNGSNWGSDKPREFRDSGGFKTNAPLMRHPLRSRDSDPWTIRTGQESTDFFESTDQFERTRQKVRRPLRDLLWLYKDPQGEVQGPFSDHEMNEWYEAGYFTPTLLVKRVWQPQFVELGTLHHNSFGTPFYTLEADILPHGEEPPNPIDSKGLKSSAGDFEEEVESMDLPKQTVQEPVKQTLIQESVPEPSIIKGSQPSLKSLVEEKPKEVNLSQVQPQINPNELYGYGVQEPSVIPIRPVLPPQFPESGVPPYGMNYPPQGPWPAWNMQGPIPPQFQRQSGPIPYTPQDFQRMMVPPPMQEIADAVMRKEGVFILDPESGMIKSVPVSGAPQVPIPIPAPQPIQQHVSTATQVPVATVPPENPWRTESRSSAPSFRDVQEKERLQQQQQQQVQVQQSPPSPVTAKAWSQPQTALGQRVPSPVPENEQQEEDEYDEFWAEEPDRATPKETNKSKETWTTVAPSSPQNLRSIQQQESLEQTKQQQQQQQQKEREQRKEPPKSWGTTPQSQQKASLKEIQELERQRLEQQRKEELARQQELARRNKEDKASQLPLNWVATQPEQKESLTLKQIQEQELEQQKRREAEMLNQKRQAQSQPTPKWGSGWNQDTGKKSAMSLREIQELEMRNRESIEPKEETYVPPPSSLGWAKPAVSDVMDIKQELKSSSSLSPTKDQKKKQPATKTEEPTPEPKKVEKKAEPSPKKASVTEQPKKSVEQQRKTREKSQPPKKAQSTAWGSSSSGSSKSLREIQEEELRSTSKTTNNTPQSNVQPSKDKDKDDSSFFWDYDSDEEPPVKPTKAEPKQATPAPTTTTAPVTKDEFPSLAPSKNQPRGVGTTVWGTPVASKKDSKPILQAAQPKKAPASSTPQQSDTSGLKGKKKKQQKLPAELLGFTVHNPRQGEIEQLDD